MHPEEMGHLLSPHVGCERWEPPSAGINREPPPVGEEECGQKTVEEDENTCLCHRDPRLSQSVPGELALQRKEVLLFILGHLLCSFPSFFANTQGVLLPAAFWDPVGQDLTSDSSFRVPRARNVILEIKRSTHSESKSPLRCLLKRLLKAKCLQLSHFGKMLASGFGG